MTKLFILSNNILNMEMNDHGSIRRYKEVNCTSKFIDASSAPENPEQLIFHKDKYLKVVNEALAKKEKTLADISTEFKAKQNILWNDISKNSKAVTDLTAKRDFIMSKFKLLDQLGKLTLKNIKNN